MLAYFIQNYGLELIAAAVCALFGVLGFAAKQLIARHLNDKDKLAVAGVVVEFVEQAWKALHGPEKLQKALETAEVLLKKKGIPFDAEEMTVLIEAAVAEFNNVFHTPLKDEAAAAATYRVPEAE